MTINMLIDFVEKNHNKVDGDGFYLLTELNKLIEKEINEYNSGMVNQYQEAI